MPLRQLLRTLDQGVAVTGAEHQADGLQHAAHLSVDLGAHGDELMAGAEQGAPLVRGDALGMHLTEPAHAQHVGQAAGVAAVRLGGPHGKGCMSVPCVHAHDWQACRSQGVEQPGRGGAGLQPDPHDVGRLGPDQRHECIRVGSRLALEQDRSLAVHHANADLPQ